MVTLDGRFVDDSLFERALSGDAGWSTAEVLRARADVLLKDEWVGLSGPAREEVLQEAEKLLQQSLTIARAQGALAWELRSATSLAQLWQRQSRCQEALDLLTPIYQRFTEGYATPDLLKVRLLIGALREHVHA
jgi:predicted ATPase